MSEAIQRTTASLITDDQLTQIYDTVEHVIQILRSVQASDPYLQSAHCRHALLKLESLPLQEVEQ